jgi:flavin-dependent dehydrogenase
LVGDAAGCVNPLNGEGIDYGLETGRLAAEFIVTNPVSMQTQWPEILREHYGLAFSAARRIAGILTTPELLRFAGPIGMRSRWLMEIALRIMGNLVTPEDTDGLARVWRTVGRASVALDERKPFS